jgi:hypothetical protein
MSQQLEMSAIPAVGDAEFAFFRDLLHSRAGIALKETKRSLVAARLGHRRACSASTRSPSTAASSKPRTLKAPRWRS